MNFDIPPGLTDLLQEFTVAVLRTRPSDLELFAANYFNNLNEKKNGPLKSNASGGLRFQTDEQEVRFQPNYDDDEDDDDELIVGMWAFLDLSLLSFL